MSSAKPIQTSVSGAGAGYQGEQCLPEEGGTQSSAETFSPASNGDAYHPNQSPPQAPNAPFTPNPVFRPVVQPSSADHSKALLREANLSAVAIWGTYLDEAHKIKMDQDKGIVGHAKGVADYIARWGKGTIHHDREEAVEKLRGLQREVGKRISRGQAGTIQEALGQIRAAGSKEMKEAAEMVNWRDQPFLTALANYTDKIPPDSFKGKGLLHHTFNELEVRGALETSFAAYALVNTLSPEKDLQGKSSQSMDALRGKSSFDRAAWKYLRSQSPLEHVVDAGMAIRTGGLSSIRHLATIRRLQAAGALTRKAAIRATIQAGAREARVFGTYGLGKDATKRDVKKSLAPKNVAKHYASAAVMIGSVKGFGTLGSAAGKGLVGRLVRHPAGLGGMMAGGAATRGLGLHEAPVGGWKEALAGDAVGYGLVSGVAGAGSLARGRTKGRSLLPSEMQLRGPASDILLPKGVRQLLGMTDAKILADPAKANSAFKRLFRQYHPDAYKGGDAHEISVRLSQWRTRYNDLLKTNPSAQANAAPKAESRTPAQMTEGSRSIDVVDRTAQAPADVAPRATDVARTPAWTFGGGASRLWGAPPSTLSLSSKILGRKGSAAEGAPSPDQPRLQMFGNEGIVEGGSPQNGTKRMSLAGANQPSLRPTSAEGTAEPVRRVDPGRAALETPREPVPARETLVTSEQAHQWVERLLNDQLGLQVMNTTDGHRSALRTELRAGLAQLLRSRGVDSLEEIKPALRRDVVHEFERWARQTVAERMTSLEAAMDSISRAIVALERPKGAGWERPVVPRQSLQWEIARLRIEAKKRENRPGMEMEAGRLTSEANRLADLNSRGGVPGAMLDIQLNGREAVVVGDLHGNEAGLDRILNSRDARGSTLTERLASNRAVLIFLGDAIHPSEAPLNAMDPSIRTLDRIVGLQTKFPDQVFYAQGNHDAVYGAGEGGFRKGNVYQGPLFRDELTNQRRLGYTRSVQQYFDSSPLIVRVMQGDAVVAVAGHSPIVRGGLTPAEAVTARIGAGERNGESIERQLTWNRPGYGDQGYTDADVARMRASLGSARTVFVSGHTPDDASAWQPGPGQVVLQASGGYNKNLSAVRVSPDGRVEVMDFTGRSDLAGVDLRAQMNQSLPPTPSR